MLLTAVNNIRFLLDEGKMAKTLSFVRTTKIAGLEKTAIFKKV